MSGTIYTSAPNTPAIISFARFEPRAIDINLTQTLRVQVHDALWMVTQQWRMGEFKGMDGGSAIRAKVNTKTSLINRLKTFKNQNAIAYLHDKPLETMVENLPVNPDLLMRVQMGRYFLKLLRNSVGNTGFSDTFTAAFPVEVPDSNDDIRKSNGNLNGLLTTLNQKSLDGFDLFEEILVDNSALFYPGPQKLLGSSTDLTSIEKDAIDEACNGFRAWYKKAFSIPDPSDISWSEKSLDYRFKVSTPVDTSANSDQTVLHADSYKYGNLEWYDFDLGNLTSESLDESGDPISNSMLGGDGDEIIQIKTNSYVPSSIEFRGLPVARWWEFEYSSLDIAAMDINRQDMLKMMVSNFGLIYSNDWMLIPLRVKAGSITAINKLLVTDVFGKHTLINPVGIGQDNDWQRWCMYNLNIKGEEPVPGDIRLFIPPSVITRQEGEALERVLFMKDEMANMVWGIEDQVPDGINGGMEGKLAELALHNYYIREGTYAPVSPSVNPNEAELKYKLTNALPEYWIPFIPVRDTSTPATDNRQIKYRRATFKRIVNGVNTDENVKPRTGILSPNGTSAYFINEEEIVKSGTIVETNFQRTRWYNGGVHTWLGRSRKNGKGEGRSGLKFDYLDPKD